jgi:energy-coupling factor transport system permease protein
MIMLRDITLGQYIPGNSVIHRLDPRAKIAVILLFLVALLCTRSLTSYIIVTVWALAALVLAGINPRFIWRGLAYFLGIVCAMALLGMLLVPGIPLIQWGWIRITDQGVLFGVVTVVRFVLLIMVSSLLTYTTSPMSLLDGITAVLKPFRQFGLPVDALAMTMTVALRFLPVVLEEAHKIMKAQMARGADFSSRNILKMSRAVVPLFVPLVLHAWKRAEDLSAVMEARCYRADIRRTEWRTLQMTPPDWGTLGLVTGLTLLVILLRLG